MKISRCFANKLHFVLDELLPPLLRDQRWVVWPAFKLLYGPKADLVLDFKTRAHLLSHGQFVEAYRALAGVGVQRETDLTPAGTEFILGQLTGRTILEVGCGSGHLAGLMSRSYKVSATDIIIADDLRCRHPEIDFYETPVEALPFADSAFDTVVCANTIEHVREPHRALEELRRVAAQRLILAVPRQRPYRYTFDLHLHFFPYRHSFEAFVGGSNDTTALVEVDRGFLYVEDRRR